MESNSFPTDNSYFFPPCSDATYHVMRDHPLHGVALPAGMFGMRRLQQEGAEHVRSDLFATMLEKGRRHKGHYLDQELLKKHLWPLMLEGSALAHDSYTCLSFKEVMDTR